MEKEFVNYNQALKLKALGFDEKCIMHWWKGKLSYYQMGDFSPTHTSAPTFSQAFRWFREKHDLFSSEVYDRGLNNGKIPVIHSYSFRILNLNNFEDFYGKIFNTYEEAELDCLNKLIEIVEGIEDIK